MVTQEHHIFGTISVAVSTSGGCTKIASMETRSMWITMEMNTNLVRAFSAELPPWQIHQNENFLWKHISWQEDYLRTDANLEPRIFKLSYGGTRFRSLPWISYPDPAFFSLASFPFKWKILKAFQILTFCVEFMFPDPAHLPGNIDRKNSFCQSLTLLLNQGSYPLM